MRLCLSRLWQRGSLAPSGAKHLPKQRPLLRVESLEERALLSTITLQDGPIWSPAGPGPLSGVSAIVGGQASGAVQALAVNPTNPDALLVGGAGGGIWSSTNGGATWTPEGDQLPSLAISSIAYSPLDASGNTVFASTGNFSSGGPSDSQTGGIFVSTNGGAVWSVLTPGTAFPDIFGLNERLSAIVPTAARDPFSDDQILLVAATDGGGVFRSNDGGVSWQPVLFGATPPTGNSYARANYATSLIRDPANDGQYYAAVPSVGIFRSDDNGETWTPIDLGNAALTADVASASRILLSVSPAAGASALYVAALGTLTPAPTPGHPFGLMNLYRSGDAGTSDSPQWTAVQNKPDVFPSGEADLYGALLADPTNPNRVYISGDADPTVPSAGLLWRVDADTNTWTPLTNATTQNAPHDGSRVMAWASGTLIEGNDGGVYGLQDPGLSSFQWSARVGNLQATQFHSVAYDAVNDSLLGGAQDNGSSFQVNSGSATPFVWQTHLGGDGQLVAVGQEADPLHYVSDAALGDFQRFTLIQDGQGNNSATNVTPVELLVNGTTPLSQVDTLGFTTQWQLNALASATNQMLIGTTHLYESFDNGDTLNQLMDGNQPLSFAGSVTAIAYGGTELGVENAAVAYVGDSTGNLKVRTAAGGPFTDVRPHADIGPIEGVTFTSDLFGPVQGIAVDPNDWSHAVVISPTQVFVTDDAGDSWDELIGGPSDPLLLSVEFLTIGNTDVLLVGGARGLYKTLLDPDPTQQDPTEPIVWSRVGPNLPNVPVTSVHYYEDADRLVVGTFGRGAWTVSNASANLLAAVPVLTITSDASGSNSFRLARNPVNPEFLDVFEGTNPTPSETFPFASVQEVTVQGIGAAVQLTLDAVRGIVIPPGGLTYDGGASASSLLLTNGAFQTETYTPTGASSGTLQFDSGVLTFSNLRQTVQDEAFAGDFVFAAPPTTSQVLLSDGASGSQISGSNSAFLTFNLRNKVNILLNEPVEAENVTVTIQSANPDPSLASVTVTTDGNGATVNVLATAEQVTTTLAGIGTGAVIHLGNAASPLALLGSVSVANLAPVPVIVDDSANLANTVATLSETGLTLGAATVNFETDAVTSLTIHNGGGADSFSITGTPVALPTTINLGGGDDVVTVTATLDSAYNLTLDGGTGSNSLTLDDPSRTSTFNENPPPPGQATVLEKFLVGQTSTYAYQNMTSVTATPSADASFVQALYHQVLERNASAADLDYWLAQMSAFGRDTVATGITRSPEAHTRVVTGYFLFYLNREAGPNEPAYFVDQLLAGATAEQVQAEILGSGEYFNRVTAGASDADTQFVQALYTQLLERQGDLEGIAFWVDRLAELGQAGVAAGFLSSTEYRRRVITQDYLNLLHRNQPPAAEELTFWVDSGMDLLSIAIAMESSPEFFKHGG